MIFLTQPLLIDQRRYALAVVLAIIAAVMIGGGSQLLLAGGSAYYLIAGIAFGGSAYLAARGDRRGVWLYGATLAGTFLWALLEGGLDPWGLQSRLAMPIGLGVWVAWPYLWRHPAWSLGALAALALCIAVTIYSSNSIETALPRDASIPSSGRGDWLHYGNDLGGSRFSPLTQITPSNVSNLGQAWVYRTGVANAGLGFEATPLMVNDTLYLCTSNNIIIALDAETGERHWEFDPKVDAPPTAACRGVAFHRVSGSPGGCAERIIFATTDARLMAVDAQTGKPCADFGAGGAVDLKRRMGSVDKGYYYVSSAPAIVRGKVVVGGFVLDGQYVGEPSGVVRAFDAVTGGFAWAWDMDHPDFNGEPPEGQTYSRGTPNSWGPMSGDEGLGLVYLPTGNSGPDYWGAHRSAGSEKYASSVVALDAVTGRVRWSFQTVHHDLWDYDVPAQPTLIDLPIDGQTVPALIQATKRGQVFLLDRQSGKPLADVEERPAPQGAAQGDYLSPTQPFSIGMPAFDNTVLSEQTMWGMTPLDQLWCRIKFRQARYDGPMTPPGLQPTINYPSYLGGINWGGVSIDPERKLMTVNWSRIANHVRLISRAEIIAMGGESVFAGGGSHVGQPTPQKGTPFAVLSQPFLSPLGVPCTQPPFGKIGVVDLNSRKLLWEHPLGTSVDSGPLGISSHLPLPMGVPNTGGSVTTRSGLVFIGATQERAIRAFDVNSGKLLWSARLPVGGHATPTIYISPKSGRQFVVIAAGGNASLSSGAGDYVVAFALPNHP